VAQWKTPSPTGYQQMRTIRPVDKILNFINTMDLCLLYLETGSPKSIIFCSDLSYCPTIVIREYNFLLKSYKRESQRKEEEGKVMHIGFRVVLGGHRCRASKDQCVGLTEFHGEKDGVRMQGKLLLSAVQDSELRTYYSWSQSIPHAVRVVRSLIRCLSST
jgi:hypothetical protein